MPSIETRLLKALHYSKTEGGEGRTPSGSWLPASPQRSPSASAFEPYHMAIELRLSRRRKAMALWQNLVDQYSATRGNRGEEHNSAHLPWVQP